MWSKSLSCPLKGCPQLKIIYQSSISLRHFQTSTFILFLQGFSIHLIFHPQIANNTNFKFLRPLVRATHKIINSPRFSSLINPQKTNIASLSFSNSFSPPTNLVLFSQEMFIMYHPMILYYPDS